MSVSPHADRIRCTATRYRGEVYTGPTVHPLIFYEVILSKYPDALYQECEEGFVTMNGVFLDRVIATKVADECGMLGPVTAGRNPYQSGLSSEDIFK